MCPVRKDVLPRKHVTFESETFFQSGPGCQFYVAAQKKKLPETTGFFRILFNIKQQKRIQDWGIVILPHLIPAPHLFHLILASSPNFATPQKIVSNCDNCMHDSNRNSAITICFVSNCDNCMNDTNRNSAITICSSKVWRKMTKRLTSHKILYPALLRILPCCPWG